MLKSSSCNVKYVIVYEVKSEEERERDDDDDVYLLKSDEKSESSIRACWSIFVWSFRREQRKSCVL